MKTLQFLAFALVVFTLASCGKFHDDGTSVWQGMLWVIPAITLIGSAIFFYKSYQSYKSGTVVQKSREEGGGFRYDKDIKTPIYKMGFFWFGIALFVATVIIIIMVNADK